MEKSERLTPFLILQSFIILGLLAFIFFLPGKWNAYRWAAAIIALPSTFCFLMARYELGRSFSITAQARELVTTGIYSKIRNPIYVFAELIVISFFLVLQRPVLLLIPVAMIPIQIIRAHKEAKVLEAKFGDAYRNYRRRTWF